MRFQITVILLFASSTATAGAPQFKPTFNGPALGLALRLPGGAQFETYRGIVVRLDEANQASVAFDADTMSMAAGWTEGGLRLEGLPFTGGHGQFPSMNGPTLFKTRNGPGWSQGDSLDEPRTGGGTPPLGPLPREWAKFRGWYLHEL